MAENEIALVLPKSQMPNVKLEYSVPPMVQGPLTYGESLGQVIVREGDDVVTRVDAVCPVGVGAPPATLDSAAAGRAVDNHVTAAADLPPAQSAAAPGGVAPTYQESR